MIETALLALMEDHRNMLRVHRRNLRDNTDHFHLPEARFEELFRFKKDAATALLNEISPFMRDGLRNTFIPKPLKMVAALHYYATGSFLRDIGQDFVCSMSKTIVCRSVKEISYIVQNHLMAKYICFPTTLEDQNRIKQRFFSSTGFPGCIGAIFCTHIKIKKPSMDVELWYMNRKGFFFSKNVQLILSCYARFGGSTHDAYIWENCKAKEFMENEHLRGMDNVERLNGVLKKVFACLSHDRGILSTPAYTGVIINSCLTLHNFS